jgi:FkbM family methyltransferase
MACWESLVKAGDLVFDVGGGDGDKAGRLSARGARVICVEPHPDRARALKSRFTGAVTGDGGAVTVVDMGLSNRTGVVPTSIPGLAIQVTTLDEMVRAFGRPTYCRIDVGGGSDSILDGLSGAPAASPIPLLSFRFDAAFMGGVYRALDRLGRLGYRRFNLRLGDATDLMFDTWTSARDIVAFLLAHGDGGAAGDRAAAAGWRGDIFARPAEARAPLAAGGTACRYAVSILRQPGNVHSECFREVAETVHAGLLALGHDAILSERTDVAGRTNIVFGSNLIANLDAPHRFAPGSILYNLEQIYDGSPWLTPDLLAAFRAHTVWDYSAANIAALARLGVAARHVPIGYVPQLTRIAPAQHQDIDVLFIGSLADRRVRVLRELERRGAKVMAVYGLYGRARDAVIARAKVVVNIHFHAAKVFEIVRASYLLANRCFVVSETGADPSVEAAFTGGVAFAEYDRLVDTCLQYLGDAAARRAVAARGFAIMASREQADLLRPVVGAARAAAARAAAVVQATARAS